MHITMPPTDRDTDIASIKRAIERKAREVEKAELALVELRAELRGLNAALDVMGVRKDSKE